MQVVIAVLFRASADDLPIRWFSRETLEMIRHVAYISWFGHVLYLVFVVSGMRGHCFILR